MEILVSQSDFSATATAEGMLQLSILIVNSQQPFPTPTLQGVVWQDGAHQKVDAVIFATGYKPNFNYLHQLGGEPVHYNGISQTVPGLFFTGLSWQRSFASATIRGVGDDAKFVVKKIRKNIRSTFKCCRRLPAIQ